MDKYEDEFKLFGLSTANLPEYKDPEQYARQFKKCSVLQEKRVSYSADSLVQNKPNLSSSTNQ